MWNWHQLMLYFTETIKKFTPDPGSNPSLHQSLLMHKPADPWHQTSSKERRVYADMIQCPASTAVVASLCLSTTRLRQKEQDSPENTLLSDQKCMHCYMGWGTECDDVDWSWGKGEIMGNILKINKFSSPVYETRNVLCSDVRRPKLTLTNQNHCLCLIPSSAPF